MAGETQETFYHLGFGRHDLVEGVKGEAPPTLAVISGDPGRAEHIARESLQDVRTLSENRGLNSYLGRLPSGRWILSTTSGMGAPSLSIVVNELVQAGLRTVLRIGTTGAIQDGIEVGSVIVSSAALCRQGAALDIAPEGFPAVADPFLTVALAESAERLGIAHRVGITASVDTFYEGQERSASSANPHLLRRNLGMTEEYRHSGVLNFEMEAATLFVMGSVYGFTAGCVCAVIAQRTENERVAADAKTLAVERAIRVALGAAERFA
ncbi:MAG: nucleoside phosphorylase [Acidobacteriota bacterium]